MNRRSLCALLAATLLVSAQFPGQASGQQADGAAPAAPAVKSRYRPQKSVKRTIEQAIKALETTSATLSPSISSVP